MNSWCTIQRTVAEMNVVRLIICDDYAPVQNVVQLVGTVLGFLVFPK